MRTITVAEFIALDGVVESPEQWHMSYINDEMMAVMYPPDSDMDTMLLGRATYDSFAGAFASAPASDPVAGIMNGLSKVVVTSAPDTVTWTNSTAVEGDVVSAVQSLKASSGGSISVIGSATLARTLLAAGLVDRLSLILHPLVVGRGARLFPADGPGSSFTLTTCTPLSTGVVHLVYTAA